MPVLVSADSRSRPTFYFEYLDRGGAANHNCRSLFDSPKEWPPAHLSHTVAFASGQQVGHGEVISGSHQCVRSPASPETLSRSHLLVRTRVQQSAANDSETTSAVASGTKVGWLVGWLAGRPADVCAVSTGWDDLRERDIRRRKTSASESKQADDAGLPFGVPRPISVFRRRGKILIRRKRLRAIGLGPWFLV